MRTISTFFVILVLSVFTILAQRTDQGTLGAVSKSGNGLGDCPLKHTRVSADISGFLARVTVVQEFENSFAEPIEAVYTFPLSQNSAVDSMTMTIGTRTIRGTIMKRVEARKIYEAAKNDGKTASLLDQERPNVFTQSVANILPGEKIIVEISYVETLKYDDGSYEFVFPMTVSPRYSPGSVADSSKISPVYAETRAGHDISIEVNLNAGVPVESIRSTSHEIDTLALGAAGGKITLRDAETIPNKDFILRYDVTGKRIEDAILTHRGPNGGFFTLILQPPDEPRVEDMTPKEIVFVLDVSGSMSGFPIEKAKEAIRLSLDGLYPHDTFNLVTFAGNTDVLFDKPVPATRANLDRAMAFLESEGGGGGTEMMKAITAALAPTDSQEHIRIVCFMTDGLVGNEAEIIAEVRKHKNARVFSFGIGDSTNRYLLDRIAEAGRGEAEYVSLSGDGSLAARKFYERVRTPLLTDISINWNGLPVSQVNPVRVGDLFSAKPVLIQGRYAKAASGKLSLRGKLGGREYVREIEINLPESEPANAVLATLWARTRIDQLIADSTFYNSDEEESFVKMPRATQAEITNIGLKFGIMTEFTSFVAVEEQIRTNGGKSRTVLVPSEVGEGIDPSVGDARNQTVTRSYNTPRTVANVTGVTLGRGQGAGNGMGDGSEDTDTIAPKPVSGGVVNGKAINLVKPSFPAAASAVRASGAVNVEVIIDEQGRVVSATAISGHPLLRAAAVSAALQSKFSITLIDGQPIKVRSMIVYNFEANQTPAAKDSPIRAEKRLTAEEFEALRRAVEEREAENRRQAVEVERTLFIEQKLHFWVFALYERLEKGQAGPAPNETKFVRDGRAALEIEVTDLSRQTLDRLRGIGFVIESTGPAAAKKPIVTGRIPIEKIRDMIGVAEVRLIVPKVL
ncbi:MAG: VWA domain-containing protein [Acidobacteria bacterium]|nr:VWA domain-containing protein [Acidobacteriota bacterium]